MIHRESSFLVNSSRCENRRNERASLDYTRPCRYSANSLSDIDVWSSSDFRISFHSYRLVSSIPADPNYGTYKLISRFFLFFQEFVVHLRETEIHSNLGNDLCYFFVLVLFVNVNFDLNVNLDFCKRTLLYVYLNIVQPCSKILRQVLYFCFNNVCS